MIERTIRTNYSKLRHFIRIDKMQMEEQSVIIELMSKGEIKGDNISDSFPAESMANPGNFAATRAGRLLSFRQLLQLDGLLCPPVHSVG